MKNFSLFFKFGFLVLVFQTCYMVAEHPEVDQTEKLGKEIGDAVEAMARQANQDFRYKQGPNDIPRYENNAVYPDYLHNKAIENEMQKKIHQLCGGETVTASFLNNAAYWYAKCLGEPGDYCARAGEFKDNIYREAKKCARELPHLYDTSVIQDTQLVTVKIDRDNEEQVVQVLLAIAGLGRWQSRFFSDDYHKFKTLDEQGNQEEESRIAEEVRQIFGDDKLAKQATYWVLHLSKCQNNDTWKYGDSCIEDLRDKRDEGNIVGYVRDLVCEYPEDPEEPFRLELDSIKKHGKPMVREKQAVVK